ncbi:ROK family protein [Actinokineospora sp. HUAS TT18]|uniref:ROK family protein n=1 Tax=Actinokineospora sp. HUAS TT18 TaxID=3447451 RepID=UPI003F52434E
MALTSPSGRAATPARQQSIREANLALVFQHIVDAPTPVSRAGISAATGITRATASALVDALINAGLVDEVGPSPRAHTGRHGIGVIPAAAGPMGLGMEVDVDYLSVCVVDLAGAIRAKAELRLDVRGRAPASVLSELAGLAHRVMAGLPGIEVAGTAVAIPGLVERGDGTVLRAPSLGWQGTAVGTLLAAELPRAVLPPTVGNNADFAALAELHVDADRVLSDFLFVSGGPGVGGGIVVNRGLFPGARGWAGEIGHCTVEVGGERCHCGARGCLETVAGTEALERGDLERAAAGLGIAVSAAVNLLDVPVVVLGGAYTALAEADKLAALVQRTVAEHVVSASWKPVQVRVSQLGGIAAALGAAASVIHRVHEDPAGWRTSHRAAFTTSA